MKTKLTTLMVLAGLALSPALFADEAQSQTNKKDNGTNATQPTSGSADSNRATQNASKGGDRANTGAADTETRATPSANSGNSNRASVERDETNASKEAKEAREKRAENAERASRPEAPANEAGRNSTANDAPAQRDQQPTAPLNEKEKDKDRATNTTGRESTPTPAPAPAPAN